jgi:hypothetical protein
MVPLDSGHKMPPVGVGESAMVLEIELAVDGTVVVAGRAKSVAPQTLGFCTAAPTADFNVQGESSPGAHEKATQSAVSAQASMH